MENSLIQEIPLKWSTAELWVIIPNLWSGSPENEGPQNFPNWLCSWWHVCWGFDVTNDRKNTKNILDRVSSPPVPWGEVLRGRDAFYAESSHAPSIPWYWDFLFILSWKCITYENGDPFLLKKKNFFQKQVFCKN